ncbi:MAG: hypothetical protein WCN95_09940, partial [bacterium]
KYTGTPSSGPWKDVPFTCEVNFQWPDKLKMTTVFKKKGRSVVQKSTIVGDATWSTVDGKPADASLAHMRAKLKDARFNLADLLSVDDGSLVLSAPEMFEGNQVQVVQATSMDGLRGTLYFDQQTGYLVKEARHEGATSADKHFVEVHLKDYKRIDGGLMFPMMCDMYSDNKLTMRITYSDVRFVKELEGDVFTQPPPPPPPRSITDRLKSIGIHVKINGVEQ